MRSRARDDRGMALITALFVVFLLGMMLFAFVFMMQSEAGFAGLNRNSTVSLGLAEAGLQEAVKRLAMFGLGPGASTFSNSLANSAQAPGSTGTVTFQAVLQNNPQLFPITSTATFGGTTRTVRLIEQSLYKPGNGNIVFGPQVSFGGDAHQITGDSYALTSVSYNQYKKAPQCSAGATATNLVSPQVFAGTYVGATTLGPSTTTPCGDTNSGPRYDTECLLSSALNEVAPTPCPGGRLSAGGYTLPQNWHPNTPIGMSSTDFTVAAEWIYANKTGLALTYGLSVANAQQNALDVPYTQAAYTPAYWSGPGSVPGSANRVLLINASSPFCVAQGASKDIKPGSYGTPCPAGYNPPGGNPYGPNAAGSADRYLDWDLVKDDMTRPAPQTFFLAPSCTAPCANPGNPNGIRYIPLVPQIDVLGRACLQNVNPGLNIFDQLGTFSCPASAPVTTISTATVPFQGTYTPPPGPESLVIDDAGYVGGVSISPSILGPGTCSSDFTKFNWGVILATGDLHFTGNTVFSGFIYTTGNIYTAGTVVFSGGIYAYSINPGVDAVDALGNFSICAGSAAALPQSPLFYNFKVISWTDVPANQP